MFLNRLIATRGLHAVTSNPNRSLLKACLERLAHAVIQAPGWFIYPQCFCFLICVGWTLTHLEFNTSRSDLVGSAQRYHRNFLDYQANFGGQDELIVVVESGDWQKNRRWVEALGSRLQAESDLFANLLYRQDLLTIGPTALRLVPELDTLLELEQMLIRATPFLGEVANMTSLSDLFFWVNLQFREASDRKASRDNPSSGPSLLVESLPMLQSLLGEMLHAVKHPETQPSANLALMTMSPRSGGGGYLSFDQGKSYLLLVQPSRPELEKQAIRRLRELVNALVREIPGINVGITGKPVMEFDEMTQSRRDTLLATVVSIGLVSLIFIFGYREVGRPIKATCCLIIALGYTLGYTSLCVGHLNILTIAFLPMLVGLAIDFGVHLITRFEEELLLHGDASRAAHQAIVNTGAGIVTGCLTTAGAFLAMALTEFKGVREMGLITGGGMLLSLIPMMTMLPAWLLSTARSSKKPSLPVPEAGHNEAARESSRPYATWRVWGWSAAVTLIALWQIPRVYFDYNLLNLQNPDLESVRYEYKLMKATDQSALYGAVITQTLQEARDVSQSIEGMNSVKSVRSLIPLLEPLESEKRRILERIVAQAFTLPLASARLNPPESHELHRAMVYCAGYLQAASTKLKGRQDMAQTRQALMALKEQISELILAVNRRDPKEVSQSLGRFQTHLFTQWSDMVECLRATVLKESLPIADLPPFLRQRFLGEDGRFLLQVFPKENLWERRHQTTFISQLRTLDKEDLNTPVITGTPVQLFEYTELLKQSYLEASIYALLAIVILVWFHFGSLLTLCLALLPVFVGCFWLLGWMGLFGIPFNPANIMTLPLILGIGVAHGIHLLHRYREESFIDLRYSSTGRAVLISAMTTMAGFSSLMLAGHQGIASLGLVMTLGVLFTLISALLILPPLITVLAEFLPASQHFRAKKNQ